MVGRKGLEPLTNGLRGHCSTIELTTHSIRNKKIEICMKYGLPAVVSKAGAAGGT